jgi:hypothetical protein
MKRRIHEGILYLDQHKRYCLYEPSIPEYKTLTCTSGCRLEIWLNRTWIAGYVEGDGEDYWLFADAGGKFLLSERMKAHYIEHHWRCSIRDISAICSSPSIRIMGHTRGQELRRITNTLIHASLYKRLERSNNLPDIDGATQASHGYAGTVG